MNGLDVLSALFVALAALDWASAAILVRGALRLRYVALEERAGAAVMLAIAASGIAALGLARLLGVTLPAGLGVTVLILALVGISLPSLIWLIAYARGRFDA